MEKLYSLEGLIEMCGDDQEFIDEMVRVFVENNTKYIAEMKQALEKGDLKGVKSNAHKIKPSILLMRIDSLTQPILDLNEFAGKEVNTEQIPALVSTVDEGMKIVFDQMNVK